MAIVNQSVPQTDTEQKQPAYATMVRASADTTVIPLDPSMVDATLRPNVTTTQVRRDLARKHICVLFPSVDVVEVAAMKVRNLEDRGELMSAVAYMTSEPLSALRVTGTIIQTLRQVCDLLGIGLVVVYDLPGQKSTPEDRLAVTDLPRLSAIDLPDLAGGPNPVPKKADVDQTIADAAAALSVNDDTAE